MRRVKTATKMKKTTPAGTSMLTGRWVLRTFATDHMSVWRSETSNKDLPVAPRAMAIRARTPWSVRTISIGSRNILTENLLRFHLDDLLKRVDEQD
jgi:hypothetical protein